MQTAPRPVDANAKYRSPRAARVAQRTKLRIAQCVGVWRHDHHCQIGRIGGSGHFRDGFFRSNSALGRHVKINSDVGSDRSSRSEETLPCSWIRCTVPISGGQSCLRSARYGLRGVRIGEASNPGPPRVRPHFSEDVVENVLSSLELELTMLESDEEPLVRPVDGHVVPRIHESPPPTVPASFRDLEAADRHPRPVVSSVLDQSTAMDDSPTFEHDEMRRETQVESGTRRRRRRLRPLPWSWGQRFGVGRTGTEVIPKCGPQDRGRFVGDSSHESDGIPRSGQWGVSSRSSSARCGCVGVRFDDCRL